MRRDDEDGYWSKIEYWQLKLSEGINKRDLELVRKATDKLSYFQKRQEEVYG